MTSPTGSQEITFSVPNALAPRIVAAINSVIPETVGMLPQDAARVFVAFQVRSVVTQYEEQIALQKARDIGRVAREKAWKDTEAILPAVVAPPTDPGIDGPSITPASA